MNCKVNVSGAEGAGEVVSDGELTKTRGGFNLTYSTDGDFCEICANGKTVTQSRRGALNTDATFVEGKRTAFVLSGGELSGEIPLFTRALDYELGDGLTLNMEYELGGAKINLRLTAKYLR